MPKYRLIPGLLNENYMLIKPINVDYEEWVSPKTGIKHFYMEYRYKSVGCAIPVSANDLYDAERLLRGRLAFDFVAFSVLEKVSAAEPEQIKKKEELSEFIERM